ncbi:hypothetical protein NPIL_170461 [Nephila pilipes]|uniref:Uncharacterized protein n=1 Tax=Nephila pilipes TaxID=299642 RepID=A0A8X6U8C7_NEPPI|nr:hypothetical protein NPIL_170461 [Nephila pilipes]
MRRKEHVPQSVILSFSFHKQGVDSDFDDLRRVARAREMSTSGDRWTWGADAEVTYANFVVNGNERSVEWCGNNEPISALTGSDYFSQRHIDAEGSVGVDFEDSCTQKLGHPRMKGDVEDLLSYNT